MTNVDYIAICDPVSVQELGHNLAALSRYSKYLADHASGIDIYAGSSLAKCQIDHTDYCGNIVYHYSHYYSRFIRVPPVRLDAIGEQLLSLSNEDAHAKAKQTAIEELTGILSKASAYQQPILFFPSIDYYSLLAIANLGDEIANSRAKLFIRFIGVMENACYCKRSGDELEILLSNIAKASKESSQSIYFFSAESPVLARRLSQQFNLTSTVTPTLVDESRLTETEEGRFTFCFPGSARMDKGFDKILSILNEIDQAYPFLDYQVYLQSLPAQELLHHYNTQRDLFKHPRVLAYPATVSQDQLRSYIQKSHILVLPYCPRTYKERSSAMMAEAACYGRQVVASSDCGFSEQISELGIGLTCANEREMARAIANYSLLEAGSLNARADDARNSYQSYLLNSYREFFNFLP